MNIEAIHVGDNPVKVTKPMMNNLNKFNTRQLQTVEIDGQIETYNENLKQLEARQVEISAQKDSEDKRIAKEALKELKSVEKEISTLQNKIAKANAEKDKLNNIQKEILGNLPSVSIVLEEKENSLSSELNDISFDLPNAEETSLVMPETTISQAEPQVEPVIPQASEPVVTEIEMPAPSNLDSEVAVEIPEPIIPEPIMETNVSEPMPEQAAEVSEPVSEPMSWPEFEYTPENPIEDIPRRIPEVEVAVPVETPQVDTNAEEVSFDDGDTSWAEIDEIPVVPIYDFEEEIEETPKLNEKSINAIDNLINKFKTKKEEPVIEDIPVVDLMPEELPVNDITLEEVEGTNEPEISQDNVENEIPEEIKEEVIEAEEPKETEKEEVEDDMPIEEEITLKDYVKFPNYQAWLFTFAEEVYGKNSFTKEEILDLENKENFVSERRFNSGRVKQAIALTNENHKLIEKTQQAIVSRNASQTLAKNLTDELNDTKAKLDDLTDKYDTQSNKLADTEKTLQDTRDELERTKEELDKTSKELDNYKNTFNKMRGIMETSSSTKNKAEDKKTKKSSKEDK